MQASRRNSLEPWRGHAFFLNTFAIRPWRGRLAGPSVRTVGVVHLFLLPGRLGETSLPAEDRKVFFAVDAALLRENGIAAQSCERKSPQNQSANLM